MLIAMETTQSVGGGEPGTQLPFIDVRPPPKPPASDLGQLWEAWRPLEANEGRLDRGPFPSTWCLPGLQREARPWHRTRSGLPGCCWHGRGEELCQSGHAKNTRQR